jgi:hypothetical protein
MKSRIPVTKPKWTGGKYAVLVGAEHQGYFRTFTGAWNWRNYLDRTLPDGTEIRIQVDGQTTNIHTVGVVHGSYI